MYFFGGGRGGGEFRSGCSKEPGLQKTPGAENWNKPRLKSSNTRGLPRGRYQIDRRIIFAILKTERYFCPEGYITTVFI